MISFVLIIAAKESTTFVKIKPIPSGMNHFALLNVIEDQLGVFQAKSGLLPVRAREMFEYCESMCQWHLKWHLLWGLNFG